MSVEHLGNIGIDDQWETPADLFLKACADYSLFPQLDVSATRETTKCKLWLGKDSPMPMGDDSFACEWDEPFFMNPPYSEITRWMCKAWSQHRQHKVAALILTYAKTDTAWWHDYVEGHSEVHFIKGRIHFLKDGKVPRWCPKCKKPRGTLKKCPKCNLSTKMNPAPYPSCWIVWRP